MTQEVNVKYIQDKLYEGYKYIEEANGRDLVLVIGNTGVGKSTTCNYLCGHQMVEVDYGGIPVIDTLSETDIKIGHEIMAETLYAKTALIKNPFSSDSQPNYICLLDCPGFLGNKTKEEQVIESVSTELAIRKAEQVKGILILISFNIIKETKVRELRELVKLLISLFKDPVEMVQYSLFIVTKKDHSPSEKIKQVTVRKMRQLEEFCKKQAVYYYENPNLASSEGLTYCDYDIIATYFSTVLNNSRNIVVIDPLDDGRSKKLILDGIHNIKVRTEGNFAIPVATEIKNANGITVGKAQPITIDDFNFSDYDAHRNLFNKAIYHLAGEGYKVMIEIQQEVTNVQAYVSDISDSKERLSKLQEEKSAIEEDLRKISEGKSQNLKTDIKRIKNWELMINQNIEWVETKEAVLKTTEEKINKLNKKLKHIDSDSPIKFIEKFIDKNVSWFKWEEMEFSADTGDLNIPIINVDKSMENGQWIDKDDRCDDGVYKIKYQSNYAAKPAKASVITYIRTKDEAGNQIIIERIKDTIDQLTEIQEGLESEIIGLNSSNEILNLNIDEAKSNVKGYKNTLEAQLERCKFNIKYYNDEIIEKENLTKETRISGLRKLQLFNKDHCKYATLVNINSLMQFKSSLIMHMFISTYNIFLPNVNAYKSCFEGSTTNFNFLNKEEKIFGLKDPITKKEIKDLVITPAGTVFDKHSLLKQFNTCDTENVPPFIFKHEDGSIEEIKYRGWNEMSKQHYQKSISSSSKCPVFIKSEVDQMSMEQLKERRDELVHEIKIMKEQLTIKEAELEEIYQKLESNVEDEDLLSNGNEV